MAEKRKTRKRSISDQSISSEQSSPSSESAAPSDALSYRSMGQPLRFDGIKSSPSSESAAPSDALSYRSMGQPLRFDGIKSSPSSESAAPSDALSYRSMGQPLRFDGIKSSPSSESAAPSDALSYRSMGQPLRFDGIKSVLTEEPGGKKRKEDLEHQRDTEEDPGGSHLLKIQTNHRKAMLRKFAKTSEGNGDQESSLDSNYTELIISTGERFPPTVGPASIPLKQRSASRSIPQLVFTLSPRTHSLMPCFAAASEMAEKRKTRKSSISDQPISSEQSSQMNEDESTAPSISASDRSKDEMMYFSKGLKRSPSSESAAPSDALSYRSMGQPLRFDGIKR
ncbi:CST complex subunit STN1 [Dissostichus eleginoides]|uniref:CST complex subunit STN1 n=1 Tax=Dissostichus eleginoides TaxID=100907 RepID=A0AAD9BUG0_DISEL|nr:CST complex subunit STN1 [Dissostichus eleginoides]